MIKMKLRNLLTVLQTGALARLCSDIYLPAKLVKGNRNLWRQVDQEKKDFDEARAMIAKKYNATDLQGAYRFVTPEAELQFNAEVIPLLDVDVTLDAQPILESVLEKRIAPMGTPFLSIDDYCALEDCGILIDDSIETPSEKKLISPDLDDVIDALAEGKEVPYANAQNA